MANESELGVRWALLIPVEVQCEYVGVPQGDYYTSLEAAIRVCAEFPEAFERATGYRPPVSYATPSTAYEGVAALGGELVFPREHQPMLRNQGRVLVRAADIDSLKPPAPDESTRFAQMVAWHCELQRRYGELAGPLSGGQEGPLTTAVLLRGQAFFQDCLLNPERAHRLIDVCTRMYIDWTLAACQVDGREPSVSWLCDDHAGLLGPRLWPEFVLPYYERIIAETSPDGCWLHSELLTRRHLPLLKSLNLAGLNLAEDQFATIDDVQRELPDLPFGWHILTVSEMRDGTPELTQRRYREIVEAGVVEVRCELCVGTPVVNIRAFLEIAEAYS